MINVQPIDLMYLGAPGLVAAYLVEAGDGPILVESGPMSTLDTLIAGLARHGYEPSDISDVVLTHIHLDHAGAAGWWAQQGAMVHVHPFGARHIVDPSRLLASAGRIYGDRLETVLGTMLPAPQTNVQPVEHRQILRLRGLRLTAIETPGHATHHHAYSMATEDRPWCFTGDAAAMIDPGSGFVTIPMPPPEFDLVRWLSSIQRLRDQSFERLFLTHFDVIETPDAHLALVADALRAQASWLRDAIARGDAREDIIAAYGAQLLAAAAEAGIDDDRRHLVVTEGLVSMNVDGAIRYWGQEAPDSRT